MSVVLDPAINGFDLLTLLVGALSCAAILLTDRHTRRH